MQLGLIFAERLNLALVPRFELGAFRADGVQYRATKSGDLTFLYDRLLDAGGRLAGLLLWCFPNDGIDAALRDVTPHRCPYLVRRSHSPTVALYEVHFRDLTPAQSDALVSDGAQEFGGQVFRSADGGLAVSVDLGDLLEEELSVEQDFTTRLAPTAHWPVVTDVVEWPVAEA